MGYAVGLGLAWAGKSGYETTGMSMALPTWLLVLVLCLAILMCTLGALLPVRKITRLDPASAFRT